MALGANKNKASEEFGAPFSSLHGAWKLMQGPVWDEFVKTIKAEQEQPMAPSSESPLKGRLERKANRSGDAPP